MAVDRPQLETIVARALPGERLREAHAQKDGRYALTLTNGERLHLQLFGSPEAATAATSALQRLQGEVDPLIPQVRASDTAGETIGQPYALLSELRGEPLYQARAHITEERLYELGRQLGETMYRVHRLACERFGQLAGDDPDAAFVERDYVLARLDRVCRRCIALQLLDQSEADELRNWFDRQFNPIGTTAALVCGGLTPHTILVRKSDGIWRISGLVGWEQALGWNPAWDHVTIFDAIDELRFFSLRVGYGNAYDDSTRRTYEQVREPVMAPYRMLLALQRMLEANTRNDDAEARRRYEVLRNLLRHLI